MLYLVNSERPTRQQKMRCQLCVSEGVAPINRDSGKTGRNRTFSAWDAVVEVCSFQLLPF